MEFGGAMDDWKDGPEIKMQTTFHVFDEDEEMELRGLIAG